MVGRAEEGQLNASPFDLLGPPGDLGAAFGVEVFFFQLGQNFLGPIDHRPRHAGQPSDMDAIAWPRRR